MSKFGQSAQAVSSSEELAQMVTGIAELAQADAVICVTESGEFTQHFPASNCPFRIIAATATPATYDALLEAGLATLRLPVHAVDKHRQVRLVLSVALRTNAVSVGEMIVCAVGQDAYPDESNLVVVTQVERSLEEILITDLLKLTDGIRPKALQCALAVASKIGRAARRGKRIGAILILGDSIKVLEGSKQLIPNPYEGHDKAIRMITNPHIHETMVELAKLDGAFIVRGDGFIQTAAAFLAASELEVESAVGLGARHMAAASITGHTDATAIVVSATDGNVRVFSGGRMVLRMDPEIEHGPLHIVD